MELCSGIVTKHCRLAAVLVQGGAVLCRALPCHAVLCYAGPCHVALCCAVLCCAVLCWAVPCCEYCAGLGCAVLCCSATVINLFLGITGLITNRDQTLGRMLEWMLQAVEQHVTFTRTPAKRVLSVLSVCQVNIQDSASTPLSHMYLRTQHT